MLSLTSLLNPTPPGPPKPPSNRSATVSSPSTSYSEAETVSSLDRPIFSRIRVRDSGRITKGSRPRGRIQFPPFEELDDAALSEISRFQVTPFGRIQESCAHIPYNSGKKDFFDKTGRESFEVFKYDFKMPGDDNEYTIMWDYNIGLVRMTPYFKCCQYGKTMPAKMLSMNPGLKDITHSITGGAISAQGYWMPYSCAKAVCATFCYKIAGALIPIFGPDFPSLCTRPDTPDYGLMAIDPLIIAKATREAEANRRHHHHHHHHHNIHTPRLGGTSASHSPRGGRTPARSTPETDPYQINRAVFTHQGRLGLEHHATRPPLYIGGSPYNTDSDESGCARSADSAASPSGSVGYFFTSAPVRARTSGWTPANQSVPASPLPREECVLSSHPWLSAVPRFAPSGPADPRLRPPVGPGSGGKRSIEDASDCGYEGGAESQSNSPSLGSPGKLGAVAEAAPACDTKRAGGEKHAGEEEKHAGEAKDAAMLLVGLSVRGWAVEFAQRAVEGLDRAKKRRRASSM
ncbi:uncharacterized protein DNG_01650 [Cephalotrichum gorgonifer]|uniref:HTH APSES-type domain-containing protein n=1 Tax=Cephalotrichum gorgonifer TaxID=2041049 RepID=A0AAE8MS40_9PEZI|nr:uncharacterized protein DNG_01650 [Cephalotrichum gorgonifer]